jgi:asparagine synthase (glutamine-hydrolysing)
VHNEHYVGVDEAAAVIPMLPLIYDEPFADSSQIPTFLVSKFARESVTVAMSGDGGDELFGGYPRHLSAPALWETIRRVPRGLRSTIGTFVAGIPEGFWNTAARTVGKRRGNQVWKLRKGLTLAGRAESFDDVYRSFFDEWAFVKSPVLGSAGPLPVPLDFPAHSPDALRMMYCDALSYLPDDILCKVDRAAMAVSLETRVPFLDHSVAELAAQIPLHMKIRPTHGKHILRSLLARELPSDLFQRPKSGFGIPVGDWIRGPLRPWAEELLDPARLRSDGWFDVAAVRRRWLSHLAGTRDCTFSIWSVLMFQSWRDAQQQYQRAA